MRVGIDIVEIERIKIAIQRSGKRFLNMVFTDDEIEKIFQPECNFEKAAGIWAVKEAAVKAIGTGYSDGVTFTNIEVKYDSCGSPYLITTGGFGEVMNNLNLKNINISISHCKCHAVAVVLIN